MRPLDSMRRLYKMQPAGMRVGMRACAGERRVMRSRCESILTALDRAPIAYHVSFRLIVSNLRLLLKREAHSREMSAIYVFTSFSIFNLPFITHISYE